MSNKINIITLGDILKNIETEETGKAKAVHLRCEECDNISIVTLFIQFVNKLLENDKDKIRVTVNF